MTADHETLIKALAKAWLPLLVAQRTSLDQLYQRVGLDPTTAPHNQPIRVEIPRSAPAFHQVHDEREGKPRVVHKGTWSDTAWYTRGDGILHKGVGWRCRSGNCNVETGDEQC